MITIVEKIQRKRSFAEMIHGQISIFFFFNEILYAFTCVCEDKRMQDAQRRIIKQSSRLTTISSAARLGMPCGWCAFTTRRILIVLRAVDSRLSASNLAAHPFRVIHSHQSERCKFSILRSYPLTHKATPSNWVQ